MKNILLITVAALGLAGCSTVSLPTNNNDKIDCYSISVNSGSNSVLFQGTYYETYSYVFEYKSADGQTLFTSGRIRRQNYDPSSGGYSTSDSEIRVFANQYSKDYTVYTFSRFIGFLVKEQNYYLSLGNRTIDSETKWSEYKYQDEPTMPPDNATSNNKEAFECASKNYYLVPGFPGDYYALTLNAVESSIERHTYMQFGADCTITYTVKWF